MKTLLTTLAAAVALGAGMTHAQTPAAAPAAQAPAPATGPASRTTATQGTGAAATAAAKAPTTTKMVQPGVVEVFGPRVNEVAAAGIQKITATPGKGGRSIAVQSPWGSSFFGWPKDVKPVAFEIVSGKSGQVATFKAPGLTDANRADYRAAAEAIVPVALAKTADAKAAKEHTRR
jgi:hypothetical protein